MRDIFRKRFDARSAEAFRPNVGTRCARYGVFKPATNLTSSPSIIFTNPDVGSIEVSVYLLLLESFRELRGRRFWSGPK